MIVSLINKKSHIFWSKSENEAIFIPDIVIKYFINQIQLLILLLRIKSKFVLDDKDLVK